MISRQESESLCACHVGNAYKELKKVADEVICTNEEHIMVHILENYLGE